MKTRIKFTVRILSLILALVTISGLAIAKDKTVSTIAIPAGCRVPDAIVYNGAANGTIQILYTHIGLTFPPGNFACFRLDMVVQDSTGAQDPHYPVGITVEQIGGNYVILTPGTTTLTATGIGQPVMGSPVDYNVAINSIVPTIPDLNEDGDTLVGNLRITASDNKLETVTNILVKVVLVHPSITNCLKVYHDLLVKDTLLPIPSLVVNIHKGGPKNDYVQSTAPPNLLDSVLVVNTCPAAQTFDELLDPADSFDPQTAAPGNSIFVYSKPGAVNFTDFVGEAGTGKGTNYCVGNLTVPSGWGLLTTFAIRIKNDNYHRSSLPNGGACDTPNTLGCVFDFSAGLYAAGSGCTGGLLPTPPVSPNPAGVSVPFTTVK